MKRRQNNLWRSGVLSRSFFALVFARRGFHSPLHNGRRSGRRTLPRTSPPNRPRRFPNSLPSVLSSPIVDVSGFVRLRTIPSIHPPPPQGVRRRTATKPKKLDERARSRCHFRMFEGGETRAEVQQDERLPGPTASKANPRSGCFSFIFFSGRPLIQQDLPTSAGSPRSSPLSHPPDVD